MEKKNIVIGCVWIFLFLALGSFLEMKPGVGEDWKESTMRHLWKTAHLHGGLFGILNLLYGLIISNRKLSGKVIFAGSILAVIGAIIFPISLFLGGISLTLVKAAPLGGLSMIAAWAIMSYAVITCTCEDS